jgi:hypothetical protein
MNIIKIIFIVLLIYYIFKLINNCYETFNNNLNISNNDIPYIELIHVPNNNIIPSTDNIIPSNDIFNKYEGPYNLYIIYNNDKYIFIPFNMLKNEYQTLIINNKPTIINKSDYYNIYNYYKYNIINNNFINIYDKNEINTIYLIKLNELNEYTNIIDYLSDNISNIYIKNNELQINNISISYKYSNILFLSNLYNYNKLLLNNDNQFINNINIINIFPSINIFTINI